MAAPRAFLAIPDRIAPEDVGHYLRLVVDTLGKNIDGLDARLRRDGRFSDERRAKSLRVMEGEVGLDMARRGNDGDVLYLVNGGRQAVWGSASNPGPGGAVPVLYVPHALLDGVQDNDTLAHAPVLGDLIGGNATPLWARIAGQTTATRKFLRQTGTGTVSAVPAWDTLTAADVPTGWQDVANLISEIVTTDKVVIGAAAALSATRFSVVNAGATTDAVMTLKGIASQSGDMLKMLNSANRSVARFDKNGSLYIGNATDAPAFVGIFFGDPTGPAAVGAAVNVISWCTGNALGPPIATADAIGCPGARIYTYKDASGQFDNGYGQDNTEAWVLVSDDTVPYTIYTILSTGSARYMRVTWDGNGDQTNFGKILSRKSLKSAGSLAAGVPGIELEQTGAGTNAIKVRAPATVGAARTQLLLDMNATIPVVGDKAPTVGSRQLGKVDSTALAAAVASTNLTNSAIAGMYLVSYTIADTTADAASLATVQFQVNYTDDAGATTQTGATVAVAALGRDKGTLTVYLTSGELSYQVNVTGVIGATAKYSLHVRVTFLG